MKRIRGFPGVVHRFSPAATLVLFIPFVYATVHMSALSTSRTCNCTTFVNTSRLALLAGQAQTTPTTSISDFHQEAPNAFIDEESLSIWLKLLASNVPSIQEVDFQGPSWLQPGICAGQNSSCWNHCVPMKGDTSKENCSSATKYELLRSAPGGAHCHASVLHAILDDTMTTLEVLGMNPMIVAGTLLGAYRNGTIIRWTRDADIMYNLSAFEVNKRKLTDRLRDLGYNLFFEGVWRVCMSTKHPLATRVYDRERCKDAIPGYRAVDVPYADLYHYRESKAGVFKIEAHGKGLKYADVFPRRHIELLGKPYKTIANPEAYFESVPYTNFMSERDLGYR